jgi:hypothetical protein
MCACMHPLFTSLKTRSDAMDHFVGRQKAQ